VFVLKEDRPSGSPAEYPGITLKNRSVFMEVSVDGRDSWLVLDP